MTDGNPTMWVQRQIDKHANTILFLLLVAALLAAVWAALGWNKARDAQRRVTQIEFARAQENIGKNVADVATCFSRARNRPQLTLILRGIAIKLDANPRAATNDLIDQYEASTPTTVDCIALAKKLGINYKPYLTNPEPNGVGKPGQK